MPYWQLYYHLVWATKNRLPLLTPEVEPIIHNYLREKARTLGGVVYALNGEKDHVHLVTSIPPKVAVAKFAGQVKGYSSTQFNKSFPNKTFFWQAEYGAFSFDRKRLPNFVAYVERQKAHHAEGSTIPVLERIKEPDEFVREIDVIYQVESADWRSEMMAYEF